MQQFLSLSSLTFPFPIWKVWYNTDLDEICQSIAHLCCIARHETKLHRSQLVPALSVIPDSSFEPVDVWNRINAAWMRRAAETLRNRFNPLCREGASIPEKKALRSMPSSGGGSGSGSARYSRWNYSCYLARLKGKSLIPRFHYSHRDVSRLSRSRTSKTNPFDVRTIRRLCIVCRSNKIFIVDLWDQKYLS